MTDKYEVRLRELYRLHVRLSETDRGAVESDLSDYFLQARPLRPTRLTSTTLTRDVRFKRIYDFMARKGYINDILPWMKPFRGQLNLADFLWTCEHVDERMYQLVPAIWLRFPMHFRNSKFVPADLERVLTHLRRDSDDGPAFHDYPYKLLKSWLWFQPLDVRCHRVPGSRLSVRLDPKATRKLENYCETAKITRSEAIHLAIQKLGV